MNNEILKKIVTSVIHKLVLLILGVIAAKAPGLLPDALIQWITTVGVDQLTVLVLGLIASGLVTLHRVVAEEKKVEKALAAPSGTSKAELKHLPAPEPAKKVEESAIPAGPHRISPSVNPEPKASAIVRIGRKIGKIFDRQ